MKLWPALREEDSLVDVTVEEAASRMAAASGRAVVLLYGTNELGELQKVVELCRAAGAEVLAFNVDQELPTLWALPQTLAYLGGPFPAVHITQWPSGHLTAAMAPMGIRVNRRWTQPIVAVRDGANGAVVQTEGLDMLQDSADRLVAACGKR